MTAGPPLGALLDPPDLASTRHGDDLGHAWAASFTAAVVADDPHAALETYGAAPSWEDRWFCLELGAAVPGADRVADAWCAAWRDHPLPRLLRAAAGAFAGDEAIAPLLDELGGAYPGDPVVDGLALVLGAELGSGAIELEPHLAELMAKAALYEPHVRFLTACSPTNGGSVDAMVDFGRTVCEVVPPGSPLRAMMPLAAIGAMVAEEPDDHLAYLTDTGLVDDVLMAAGQSVFHPAFEGQSRIPAMKAMNAFAVGLSLAANDDLALALVDRLGESYTDWPLALLGPPSQETWREFRLLTIARAEDAAGSRI